MFLINLANPSRRPDRLLTETDVARAHIAAPHVLAAWQTRDAHYWRRASLGFLIGAAVPVFGYFALHWPIVAILLALLLDVLAVWICDALKLILAQHRAQEELAHILEAAGIMAVIRALQRPRQPRHRDLLAPPLRAALYLIPSDPGQDWGRLRGFAALALIVVVGLLTSLLFRLFDASDLLLLLAGVLLRIGWSAALTIRARNDTASRPELLPEWIAPTMALLALALLLTMLYNAGIIPALKLHEPSPLGGLVLLLHFLIVALLSWLGQHQVRVLVDSLRTFAARDREQLKQRVRQINAAQ